VSEFVEVYRTPSVRANRERALVLNSQSIPFLEFEREGWHVLVVEAHWAERAATELARYEQENRGFKKPIALRPAAPGMRVGSVVFAALLLLLGFLQWNRAFGLDWEGAGVAHAAALRSGELWRAVTALTLHVDLAHLASNLLFGLAFGVLVAHGHGGGLGYLAILVAGALGNWTNAWVQAPEHVSLGASTAVFGAVGVLCGSEARRRHLLSEARTRRFAPVGVALVFLSYLGLGEVQPPRSVDILAHCFGLAWGLVLGAVLPWFLERGALGRGAQLVCGAAALALVALCWRLAL